MYGNINVGMVNESGYGVTWDLYTPGGWREISGHLWLLFDCRLTFQG